MKSQTLMNGFGRELTFDRHGLVAAGDANGLDLDQIAMGNMDVLDDDTVAQSSLRRRQIAADLAIGPLYGTELALDADEWEEIPSQATEVEEESDEDAPETDAEDAIFTPAPVAEAEDRYSRLATAVEAVETHPLVKEFGFPVDSLITAVDSDHPVAMGFEILAVVLAACQATDELTDLAGHLEVNKVLGWIGNTPPELGNFGADRLFRSAGALKARIAQIREERARLKSGLKREAAGRKVGGIRPRLAIPNRTTHPHQENRMTATPVALARPAPAPAHRPEPGSSARALLARIEAGRNAAAGLHSHGAGKLLERALATRNEEQAQRLVADVERMLRACEATPLPTHRPSTAPRAPAPKPACFGNGSPNTAARKAAQLAKKRATTAKFSCPKGSSNATPQGKGGKKKGKK